MHVPDPDALIAELAARQFGRVNRNQLLGSGISAGQIRHRVRRGLLIPERRGVYAVAFQAHGQRERWATALLDVGPGSLLSHFASANAHGFWEEPPWTIDVTNAQRCRSRRGIRVHHREIHPTEIRVVRGLPLTSPAQTLFDLAAMVSVRRVARASNEAFVAKAVTLDDLYSVIDRNPRRKGAKAFRKMLTLLDPEGREIRSGLEARLNTFLRARGYPPWEQNVPLLIGSDRIKPDVLWREQQVIVEADGRDPHSAPLTFISDRRRDRRLQVEGWHPVRVTSGDLGPGAQELDADLRALLGL